MSMLKINELSDISGGESSLLNNGNLRVLTHTASAIVAQHLFQSQIPTMLSLVLGPSGLFLSFILFDRKTSERESC